MAARGAEIGRSADTILVHVKTVRPGCKPFDVGRDSHALRFFSEIDGATHLSAAPRRQHRDGSRARPLIRSPTQKLVSGWPSTQLETRYPPSVLSTT